MGAKLSARNMSHRHRTAIAVGRWTAIDFKAGKNIRRLSNDLEDFEDHFDDSLCTDQSSTQNSPEPAKPVVRTDRRTGRDVRSGENIRRRSNGLENYFTDDPGQLSSKNDNKRSSPVVHGSSSVDSVENGKSVSASPDGKEEHGISLPDAKAETNNTLEVERASTHRARSRFLSPSTFHITPTAKADVQYFGNITPTCIGGTTSTNGSTTPSPRVQGVQSQQSTTGVCKRKRFKPIYPQELRNYKCTSASPFNMHASENSLRKEEAPENSPNKCETNTRRTPILCSTRLDGGVLPLGVQKDFCRGVSPLNSEHEPPYNASMPALSLSLQHEVINTEQLHCVLKTSTSSGAAQTVSDDPTLNLIISAVGLQQKSPRRSNMSSTQNSKVEACHLRSVTETTSQEALESSLKGQQLLSQRSEQGDSSRRSPQSGDRKSSRKNSLGEKTVASPLINSISSHSAPEKVLPAKNGEMEEGDKPPSLVNKQVLTGNRRRKSVCPPELKVAPKARRTTNNKNHINLDHDGRPPESELKVEKSLSRTRRSAKISLTEDGQPDRNISEEKLSPRSTTGEELPATPLMLSHTRSNQRQRETSDESIEGALEKQDGKQNVHKGNEERVVTRKKRLLCFSGGLQNARESPEILKMHEKPSPPLVISASHSAHRVYNNSSPSSDEGQNLPGSPPQQLLPVENLNSPLPLTKEKTKDKRMSSKSKRAVRGPAAPDLSHSKHQLQPRRSTRLNKTNQPAPAKPSRQYVKGAPVSRPKINTALRRGTRTRQPPPPRNGLYRPVYEYTMDGPVFKEHVAHGTYEDPYKWAFASEIRTTKAKNAHEKHATAVVKATPSGKAHSKQRPQDPESSGNASAAVVLDPSLLHFGDMGDVRDVIIRRACDVKFQQQDETGGQYEVATQYMLKSCHTGLVRIHPGQAKQVSDTHQNNIIFTALDYPVHLATLHNTWVVLSKGDSCLVPKGTSYSIQNLSKDHGAELHFTVVC